MYPYTNNVITSERKFTKKKISEAHSLHLPIVRLSDCVLPNKKMKRLGLVLGSDALTVNNDYNFGSMATF